MREVFGVAAICCAVLTVGCSAIRQGVDMGLEAREAYEARKAEEQAAKDRAEQERLTAEAERRANEQEAKEAAEAAEAAKYAEGPSTLEHGRRGFLWKPISDNTKKPALLLPPRFTGKTRLVTVDGAKVKLDKVANGYREHFRMKQHFTGPVTVQAEASDGEGGAWYRWTWVISEPAIRNDSNITPRKDAL